MSEILKGEIVFHQGEQWRNGAPAELDINATTDGNPPQHFNSRFVFDDAVEASMDELIERFKNLTIKVDFGGR